jgi:hypothetical protein
MSHGVCTPLKATVNRPRAAIASRAASAMSTAAA